MKNMTDQLENVTFRPFIHSAQPYKVIAKKTCNIELVKLLKLLY
jgi:hypothetical protein